MIQRTYVIKRKRGLKGDTYRIQRAKRDLWKAYIYPTRFIREMWRWIKLPFKLVALVYRCITGKQRFIWDG